MEVWGIRGVAGRGAHSLCCDAGRHPAGRCRGDEGGVEGMDDAAHRFATPSCLVLSKFCLGKALGLPTDTVLGMNPRSTVCVFGAS